MGRLAHPHGLRRRPHRRVRGADGRGALRGRRHQRHGGGDAGRLGRRARGEPDAPGGGGEAPGHHHAGDQDRLRADDRRRGALRSHRGPPRGRRDVPGRPRRPAGCGSGRVPRPGDGAHARRRGAARECGRRLLRVGGVRRGRLPPRAGGGPRRGAGGAGPREPARARPRGPPRRRARGPERGSPRVPGGEGHRRAPRSHSDAGHARCGSVRQNGHHLVLSKGSP
jgi:hypothetical protein